MDDLEFIFVSLIKWTNIIFVGIDSWQMIIHCCGRSQNNWIFLALMNDTNFHFWIKYFEFLIFLELYEISFQVFCDFHYFTVTMRREY